MAVPAFLSSSFSYPEDVGVTDVANVIIALRDELLNQQTPAWTEPVGGTFKSPPDANGRFIEFDISAVSTTRIRMLARDDSGRTIKNRTADITATDTVRYFTGRHYAVIEFVNVTVATTGEAIGCGLTDLTPDASSAVRDNAWMFGRRDSAGTLDATSDTWSEFDMFDNGTIASVRRAEAPADSTATAIALWSHTGRLVTRPVLLCSTPKANPFSARQPIGRLYQSVVVPDELGPGDEVTVPIDDALSGVFKVTVRTVDNAAFRNAWRIA